MRNKTPKSVFQIYIFINIIGPHRCHNCTVWKWKQFTSYALAMVTSTSTPVSKFIEVTCLTNSLGECKSMMRLWTRIWNLSQVLLPSPQGVLRVVIRSTLVGQRTGPCGIEETNECKNQLVSIAAIAGGVGRESLWRLRLRLHTLTGKLSFLAREIKSLHTFSNERTLAEVKVMRIRCTGATSDFGFSMSLPTVVDACNILNKIEY